jgi:Alpha-galactosidases/6-phospho-beta-glucosidases, family 4 of glycosyl hydrolases
MPKITFMGAGSTVFAKNIIGDSFCAPALSDSEIALYDIDAERLRQSEAMLNTINKNINSGRAKIKTFLGVENRKKALKGANFVVNAIQVGGYEPSTVIDFEIPKKYGLRQTIADTLGIGGIFRTLRTLPVMLDFAADMEKVCPDAWLLNYTNPMAMLTGGMLRGTSVKTVGLCHSVQENALWLLDSLGLLPSGVDYKHGLRQKVAGINHMAWLLEVDINGKDMYPAIKAAAAAKVEESLRQKDITKKSYDMVRLDLIRHFGYYITESSEHNAEYTPYWIKRARPELIDKYRIPLDEYPRRCVNQIAGWKKQYKDVCENPALTHKRTHEFGSYIMEAITTNVPFQIAGNVLNKGFITNLPADCCVEVPCLVDANGVQGTYVGALPPQCAALNLTNINVQNLTIEAVLTKKREHIYHAALLDPHTAAELAIDDIVKLCDELIAAHGDYLPKYK